VKVPSVSFVPAENGLLRLPVRLFALAGLAAAALCAPLQAKAACTGGATLSGSYGVLVSGATAANVPKYLDGVITFNGACGLSGEVTIGEPGKATQNFATIAGTYTTNADGTIGLSLSLPNVSAVETYVVGYSAVFGEALGEETDSSAIATIDLKPQTFPNPATASTYSNASLKGTWTAACIGAGGGFSDLNYFVFDGTSNSSGVGNITNGVDDSNNNAAFYDTPYTGTYAVAANGVLGGNVVVAGTNYGFTGVIDNNGNEIQYVFTKPGSLPYGFVGCTAKRVAAVAVAPTAACHVTYAVTNSYLGGFQGGITIGNTGTQALSSWKVTWTYANGQVLTSVTNGTASQSGANVSISNTSSNGAIAPGATYSGVTFSGLDLLVNSAPTSFAVNGVTCK
jgi:hypothetical protein